MTESKVIKAESNKKRELLDKQKKQMKDASRRLEFEQAAYIRDQIKKVREE